MVSYGAALSAAERGSQWMQLGLLHRELQVKGGVCPLLGENVLLVGLKHVFVHPFDDLFVHMFFFVFHVWLYCS